MICFYFKRKIDNLELSQSEQAKMLYNILQEQNNSIQEDRNTPSSQYNVLDGLDLNQLKTSEPEEESDSDGTADGDSRASPAKARGKAKGSAAAGTAAATVPQTMPAAMTSWHKKSVAGASEGHSAHDAVGHWSRAMLGF